MKNDKKIFNILFIVLCIAFSLFLMIFIKIDSDYLWHVKAGEYMVKNHTILTHDVFSWVASGKYWMSHEWGFEVLIYIFKLIFSKYSIFVYGLICTVTLLLIIYYINKDKFYDNKLFALVWIVLGLIIGPLLSARPHLISNIFLLLTVYFCIDFCKNENSKKIYFLPLIAILWANFHGGSSNLVYTIPLIIMFAGLFKFNFSKIESSRLSKKQFITFLIIIVVSILCININPHGFKMVTYPYENIMDKTMINTISEWRSTQLNDNTHLMYFVFAFIVLGIFLLSKKKINFRDFMLFLFALFLGLKSIRFWAYLYIVMSVIVFNYIDKRKDDPYTKTIFLFMSFIFALTFGLAFNKNIMNNTTKLDLTNQFIDNIKREKPKRMFNLYNIGGELVYNDIDVFIDGRADLYSKINFSDCIIISNLSGDYKAMIEKYNFDYYVVNTSFSIYYYLLYDDNYEELARDGEYVLFKAKSVS